jgi:hypothetical protein
VQDQFINSQQRSLALESKSDILEYQRTVPSPSETMITQEYEFCEVNIQD